MQRAKEKQNSKKQGIERKDTGRKGRQRRKGLTFWRFGQAGRRKVRRQIKDRLFRFLFEKDKEALLQLYNALNGTAYQDASRLEVVTIENAVYIVMKNDLAFVIAGTLNLYEHQSTFNPNMPVRFLIYLAEEYQKLVEQAEASIYGTRQVILPAPQCIVFYNGEKTMPEEKILSLSDAFENQRARSDVELKVRMLNINYGNNQELMEKCRVLKEYAEFVEVARRYLMEGKERQEALNMAIDYCIAHDILSVFLRNYRAEVLGMLLEEFDVDKYERTLKAEGREEGIEIGAERAFALTRKLVEQNRMDDLK
ncbi:MAG: Rpn family recombination-promoting nuclease/putative transposase, partial [Lachnospiraceae bacterium]|nr:Rpn family recombination-promoting nuclease/putative transposase [Lachnospiraceae bacterium]